MRRKHGNTTLADDLATIAPWMKQRLRSQIGEFPNRPLFYQLLAYDYPNKATAGGSFRSI